MKKHNKTISIMLIFLILISLFTFPDSANAVEQNGSISLENGGGNLLYTISDDKVTITGYEGSASEINLPAQIEGYQVTKLGMRAFAENIDVKKITIPNGVTEIAAMAFYNCSALESVGMTDTVTTLGNSVFSGCSMLSDLELSDNISSLGEFVFADCSSLVEISLPNAIITGKGVFYQCSNLEKTTLSENLNTISESMFRGCVNLSEVNNISGIKNIGKFAFYSCEKLPNIPFSDVLESIGESAFYGCNSLVSINIPDSVKQFEKTAFCYCANLESVHLGNGITTIPYMAFSYCNKLESIDIPNTVTSIGSRAFWRSKGIKKITLPESIEEIASYAFSECSKLSEINIPDGVKKIGVGCIEKTAYYNNSENWDGYCLYINKALLNVKTSISDEQLIIKEGTKVIAGSAVKQCNGIKNVLLPNGVVFIGEGAFAACSSLESINIPDGVTDISTDAFYNCSNLSELTVPASVENIGSHAMGYRYLENTVQLYDFTIKGYSGTAAEKYAKQNSIDFVDLNNPEGEQVVENMAVELDSFDSNPEPTLPPNVYYNLPPFNTNDYETFSRIVDSYLYEENSGLVMLQADIENVDGYIVKYYDSDYQCTKVLRIKKELPVFGAFYSNDDYYFILSAQNNPEESQDIATFRMTKYDKNWNKLYTSELYGANTTVPFDGGSARITEIGGDLVVRTCHEMYESYDGNHHQANATIRYNIMTGKITEKYMGVSYLPYGYAAHSFNQYVKADGNSVISVDHADAYPRSVVLSKHTSSDATQVDLLEFPGGLGQNYTGSSVGGLEVMDSSYIVAVNNVDFDDFNNSTTRNITLLSCDKDLGNIKQTKITDYPEGSASASTPQLVKINDNKAILLWTRSSSVYYTEINANGEQVGEIHSFNGDLSDCQPIVYNGSIVWYTWRNYETKFYRIDVNDISQVNHYTVPVSVPTEPTETTTESPTETTEETPLNMGDVDKNGRVSIRDVTTIQLGLAQTIVLDKAQIKAADVNSDNVVNVNDCTLIQMYLVGLIDSLPVVSNGS